MFWEGCVTAIAQWLSITGICISLLFTRDIPIRKVSSTATPKSSACTGPEYHQFDFWVGDWDAFEDGAATPDARLHVDRILNGCVVREGYQDTNGMKGQSLSIYDSSRNVWHQTWVTNRGRLLVIEGGFTNEEMVLTGTDLTESGLKRQVRGRWKAVKGGVRETADTSLDGGKTWKPWFDILFRPHQP
jgi:hypothetical protein